MPNTCMRVFRGTQVLARCINLLVNQLFLSFFGLPRCHVRSRHGCGVISGNGDTVQVCLLWFEIVVYRFVLGPGKRFLCFFECRTKNHFAITIITYLPYVRLLEDSPKRLDDSSSSRPLCQPYFSSTRPFKGKTTAAAAGCCCLLFSARQRQPALAFEKSAVVCGRFLPLTSTCVLVGTRDGRVGCMLCWLHGWAPRTGGAKA